AAPVLPGQRRPAAPAGWCGWPAGTLPGPARRQLGCEAGWRSCGGGAAPAPRAAQRRPGPELPRLRRSPFPPRHVTVEEVPGRQPPGAIGADPAREALEVAEDALGPVDVVDLAALG